MTRHEKTSEIQQSASPGHGRDGGGGDMMYLRFGAMILTAMVLMYAVMYMGTFEWDHVRWSESRMFMTLAMGGTMGLVMLGWMLNMYKNPKINVAIVAGSVLLLAVAVFLHRSQTTVEDTPS